MCIENISVNIKLSKTPTNGIEAYELLVAAVKREIEEKKIILQELQEAEVKKEFIDSWSISTKKLSVYDI